MFTLNCKGRLLVIDHPIVMGILNATQDSFFAESRVHDTDSAVKKAAMMINDGATILDIGGQSTRPGSTLISAEEELHRVLPLIIDIHSAFPDKIISVDTFYASVAAEAVSAGASIINDISAGSMDDKMISTVAKLGVPYILMHMPGTPQTMRHHLPYSNVALEVLDFMSAKLAMLHESGIKDVIVDPGFGFGKNVSNNFQLMNNLEIFRILDKPILLGISRKSFIYKSLNLTPQESLNGTSIMNSIGVMKGANILRVHDVKEAVEVVRLVTGTIGITKKGII